MEFSDGIVYLGANNIMCTDVDLARLQIKRLKNV